MNAESGAPKTARQKLLALDPVAAARLLEQCRLKIVVPCSRCGGTGVYWGPRAWSGRTCWGCSGTGVTHRWRSDSRRIRWYAERILQSPDPVESLRALAATISGPRRIVSDDAADLAAEIQLEAEMAAYVQAEPTDRDRADVREMFVRVRDILEGE